MVAGYTRRTITLTIFTICLLFSFTSYVSGQDEKAIVEDARVKMKLKDYDKAETILQEAQGKYPNSVAVAEATVNLYEEMKRTEDLIEAYKNLIDIIKMKEVQDGTLNTKDSTLLKDIERKLESLTKARTSTDAIVEQFVKESLEICKTMISAKKLAEASFVIQRNYPFNIQREELNTLTLEIGEENMRRVSPPEEGKSGNTAEAGKLLLDAQKLFKENKFDEATIACKAALETAPGLAAAVALLYDIKEKTGKTDEMIVHGLNYFLFPIEIQSSIRTEDIEKGLSNASTELKLFFDTTRKKTDDLCKLAEKAIKDKNDEDVAYIAERIAVLTHRTKKLDSILSKVTSTSLNKSVEITKLLAQDDFNKVSDAWFLKEGRSSYENGKFVINSEINKPFCAEYYLDFRPENYYAECTVEIRDGLQAKTAGGGLVFRSNSGSNYYTFMVSPEGKFGIWLIKEAAKFDLTGKEDKSVDGFACGAESKYINKGKAKNTIAVASIGSKHFFFVNKHQVFTCEDTTFNKGAFGLFVSMGNITCAFDNFKVYKASIPAKK